MPDRSWKLLSTRQIADYKILRLREDRYLFEPTQAEGNFIVCDSSDWALVLPITPEGQVVLVRQYRHGVRQVVLEVPGGILDHGETPEASARAGTSRGDGLRGGKHSTARKDDAQPGSTTPTCTSHWQRDAGGSESRSPTRSSGLKLCCALWATSPE